MTATDTELAADRGLITMRSGLLWSAASIASMTVSGVVLVAVLTRLLTKEDFGAFAATQTVCVLAAVVGRYGSDQLMLRELAPGPGGAVRWAAGASILRNAFTAATLVAAGVAGALWFALPDGLAGRPLVVGAAFAWVLTESTRLAFSEALRTTGRFVLGTLTGHLGRSVLVLAAAGVLVAGDIDSVAGAVTAVAAASAVTAVAAAASYGWARSRDAAGRTPRSRLDDRALRRHGLFLATSGASSTGLMQADVLVVAVLADEASAGSYSVALRLANLLALPLYVTAFLSAPIIARWMRRRGAEGADQVTAVRRLVTWHSIAMVAGFLGLLAFGPLAIGTLAGDGYDDAYLPAVLLAAGVVVNGLTGPAGDVVVLSGRSSWLAVANLAALAGAVTAAVAGYAAVGEVEVVAGAFALAMATQNTVLARLAAKRIGFSTLPDRRLLGVR